MPLSNEQQRVLELCAEYNTFITGAAGTGKTYLLQVIIKYFQEKFGQSSVGVTASTGKAAFPLGGFTFHSFFGIGCGAQSAYQLLQSVRANEELVHKIQNLRVLIIDEVSMLGAEVFEKVEFICRQIRSNSCPFGGVHLILCGDFYQLPPVRSSYLFKSPYFVSSIDICVELKEIHRQSELDLISLLQDARQGHFSSSSLALLNELTRPLNHSSLRIYSLRSDVEMYNLTKIKEMAGEEYLYRSSDSGRDKSVLKQCNAPNVLTLKIGAPVMLVKNMIHVHPSLVNGLAGTVTSISSAGPIILFENGSRYCIRTCDFPVYNSNGVLMATRKQLPLQLAFGITVHRSQGMSIKHLEVNMQNYFEPGQLYVALSRATSISGLRVLPGFSLSFPRVSNEVSSFYLSHVRPYDSLNVPPVSKRSSCISHGEIPHTAHLAPASADIIDPSEYPSPPPVREEVDQLTIINAICQNHLNGPLLNNFLQEIHLQSNTPSEFNDFIAYCVNYFDQKISARNKIQFNFVSLIQSPETRYWWSRVCDLLHSSFPADICQSAMWLCVRECYNYLIFLLKQDSSVGTEFTDVNIMHEFVPVFDEIISNETLCGNIRYVGGWAVHKCRKQCIRLKMNKKYAIAFSQLNSFVCSRDETHRNTKYPSSLQHICRFDRGALLYINDDLFEFLCCVEHLCQQLFTESNVHKFQSNVTKDIQHAILSNFYLQNMWHSMTDASLYSSASVPENDVYDLSVLFEESVAISNGQPNTSENDPTVPSLDSCQESLFLFNMILTKYLHMRAKEFLKRIGVKLNPKKSVALRKELAVGSSSQAHLETPSTSKKRFFFKPWMVSTLQTDYANELHRDPVILQSRASEFGCEIKSIKGWHQRYHAKRKNSEP